MRGCPSAGHGWSCEGPWEVIGRPGVSLGGPGRCLVCTWRGLERPWGPWEVLERPSRRLWGSLEVLGGSSGGHKRSLDVPWGSLRVLGGPWGGLPLIVPGGSLWLMRGTEPRQSLDEMRFWDAQDASRSLETRPDMSSDAKRSSLAHPKGPRSAQGRPGNTLESPKDSKVSPKGAQEMLMGAPVRGNIRKPVVFE